MFYLLYVCVFVLFLLLATWLLTQNINKEELNNNNSNNNNNNIIIIIIIII